MAIFMKQPQEVHLTEPISPNPYPGCDVCAALVREWIAVTEPASPLFDLAKAHRIVDETRDHRNQDEATAPAI
ncbi:hypothetical protein ACFCX0_44100 [Streptomyces sp. NPDC056352]|uniref:hypothetical protein n=1 Tax=Streptomyces sp. NPDC056352 TaxID=3345791 RepID=UPI0035D6B5E2